MSLSSTVISLRFSLFICCSSTCSSTDEARFTWSQRGQGFLPRPWLLINLDITYRPLSVPQSQVKSHIPQPQPFSISCHCCNLWSLPFTHATQPSTFCLAAQSPSSHLACWSGLQLHLRSYLWTESRNPLQAPYIGTHYIGKPSSSSIHWYILFAHALNRHEIPWRPVLVRVRTYTGNVINSPHWCVGWCSVRVTLNIALFYAFW